MPKKLPDKCLLVPTKEDEVIETSLATLWKRNGIIYSRSKVYRRSLQTLKEFFEKVRELSGNSKSYFICDVNEMQNYSKDETEYFRKNIQDICLGVAIVACHPMGKMMATVTILKKKPPFPAKIFDDPGEAEAWVEGLKKENADK